MESCSKKVDLLYGSVVPKVGSVEPFDYVKQGLGFQNASLSNIKPNFTKIPDVQKKQAFTPLEVYLLG